MSKQFPVSEYYAVSKEFGKWLILSIVIGTIVGIVCATLLFSLNWSTQYREHHQYIIWFLPIAGFLVGLLYHHYGQSVAKGNNQLLEELNTPENIIPFRMAPFIFLGTVASHLFGASVGREGTAVQIGGAIADQFSGWLKMSKPNRRIVILMGISSGFAGLFGTPLAGAVFALEVLFIGKVKYNAILPCIFVAIVADFVSREMAHILHIPHANYEINFVPNLSAANFFWTVLVGIMFGITSIFFSKGIRFFSSISKYITYPPLRPIVGGLIVSVLVYYIGTKYIGLGVSTILESFTVTMNSYDFIIKLLLTTFCIAFGFKGGEVTPLFFIGATLGSALSLIIPLPIGLLAGMGFVAVFSGAANTPFACIFMGIELFGIESGVFLAIVCVTAYMFSGHTGIYSSQIVGTSKSAMHNKEQGTTLKNIDRG
ncbi:voltage-gated chloride channel family protein [Wenyingzhuangia sp. IMCC45533]